MKTKYLYSCVVALALLAGCIKDEGEILTVVRTNVTDSTVITAEDGYMQGVARMDMVTENYFDKVVNSQNQIEELNCYTRLQSEFTGLDAARNGKIKSVGYVYSHENKTPVISDKQRCNTYYVPGVTPSEPSVSFSGLLTKLDPNSTYYVRSFAVCEGDGKNDSVIYNSRVLEYKTVLPEDVWVQRSDAPNTMSGRSMPFVCTKGQSVYVYGGRSGASCYNDLWRYNPDTDTWEQQGTFEATNSHYIGTEERCNGAMFAYPNVKAQDTLLYVVGGEFGNGTYTATVFYYSTKNNRFAYQADHPNAGTQFPVYDENGAPVYKTDDDGNIIEPKVQEMRSMVRSYVEDLPIYKPINQGNGVITNKYFGLAGAVAFSMPGIDGTTRYYIAFGKNDITDSDQKHIQTNVYEYDVKYDRTCNGVNEVSEWAWKNWSIGGDDRSIEGLYQAVCVQCGDRVILGTGESTKGRVSDNFYSVSFSKSDLTIRMEQLPYNDEFTNGFKPRANASAFYLNYTKDGVQYDRFYVGCGRTCLEDDYVQEPEQLLNDFWCYDFNTRQWSRKADCSNVLRQGAAGFTIKRKDDYFVKEKFSVNERGMFTFGEGYIPGDGYRGSLNDNWEYIP